MRSHPIEGFPRLLFPAGITSLSNTTANEKVGIMFCLIIASLQLEGQTIFLEEGKISDSQFVDILYVFEMMVCYRAWLKLDKYWKRDDIEAFMSAQQLIEKLLQSIIKLMPRSTGQSWYISKIHEQLHVAENIKYFGAHQNVHTGPQEHNHIENTKKPSKLVQRRKSTLDLQLAIRLSEKWLINSAFQKVNNVNDDMPPKVTSITETSDFCIGSLGSKYIFTLTESNSNVTVEFDHHTHAKNITPITNAVLECIIDHFGTDIYGKQLYGFTEMKNGNNIYCADVNYCNKGNWKDNVMVAWESNKKQKRSDNTTNDEMSQKDTDTIYVPCTILSMFQIKDKEQLYCVVHSCHYQSDKLSVLSSIWMKEYQDLPVARFKEYKTMQPAFPLVGKKPIYCIIEAESVVKHCLLIPYHAESCYSLLIKDVVKWAEEFHQIN